MLRNVAPVETEFAGIMFRSRTEARWAVFFHALNLDYVYEAERLTLSSGESYLPDFFLPDLNAYFEVKPNSEAIVTPECKRARALAADRGNQRVWLAMGYPNIDEANILPLNQWPTDVPIDEILASLENRYRFMEDRRDEEIYWLHSEFIKDQFAHSYMVGGKGTSTDHDRLPMIKGRVEKAYRDSREAFGV